MAQKTKRNQETERKATFIGVVQIPLLDDHEPLIFEAYPTAEAILEHMDICVQSGYAIEVRYDYERTISTATLKGFTESCVNAGLWLFGSGDNCISALQAVLFKHFQICEQNDWRLKAEQKRNSRFR